MHLHMLTLFPETPAHGDIPAVMPSPFLNHPHPLAERAARMLQQRLSSAGDDMNRLLSTGTGKMFGVLVVRDQAGHIGYLSAFSGMARGSWHVPGFVPPVFDERLHQSFLPAGRAMLTKLTEQISQLESLPLRAQLGHQISQLQQQRQDAISALKQRHRSNKEQRKMQRMQLQGVACDEREPRMAALALASQHDKREATDTALAWEQRLDAIQQQLEAIEQQLLDLKSSRSEQSRALHRQVFAAYRLHNFAGRQQTILHFFADSTPPAGSGDCAAPKLIHYANQHNLQPLAMAEFWWGPSPATGIRHHGHFYPACRGKCRPILPFMLEGIAVEKEPCFGAATHAGELEIIYEDPYLWVVNKPAGLMSAPGKEVEDSVYSRLCQRHPEYPELRLVHRLDMGTSGLLLVAKQLRTHKQLQKQFIQHRVEKCYEALLSKVLPAEPAAGEINLPLRVDMDDRPRQMVCHMHGKPARTRWKIIAREQQTTRVHFYPLTGRTHQLRVHAAHRDGLNAAIVGDGLYGDSGKRMLLHARSLCFTHPVSRESLTFEAAAPF
ncbi:RluA family pseudouridine synthase [Mariprofundus erugo]|nr:RluA family pseudouridine synthase [Mariprofundus erugo]